MEASLVKILEQYRENEDPDLRQVDGKCLSTFSKEELMGELTKRNIDGVLLCRIGGINPLPEYLCRLVHYAMDRDTEDPIPGPSTKEDGPSVAKKKKKTSDAVTMVGLAEKIEKLEKELKEKKSSDEVSEFERAKRDVREEAQKAEEVFMLKDWEEEIILNFDPQVVTPRRPRRVNAQGFPVDSRVYDSAETAFQKTEDGITPQLKTLPFYDPDYFVAGQIHNSQKGWQHIFDDVGSAEEIRAWVKCRVDIFQYIRPFRGMFWGEHYDAEFPPRKWFNNSNKCKDFIDFIGDTIYERLVNGSIECLGRIEEVQRPLIIGPLVVEPSKPRLCINLMFLNNWIEDRPFSLDTLKDIPRAVGEGASFTLVDDKSGFDNVFLEPGSANLVVFQWAGYYFRCLTLPFGFKLSSYIYHTLNLQPTSYIRKRFSIPMFLYIDDRLIEELRYSHLVGGVNRALAANYIVCEILIRLGYCINLSKSVLQPTQQPVFLGFIVDSVEKCFRLTQAKKSKFAVLRDDCLKKSSLSVRDLQKLSGRAVSFMLVVPGAKLFTREMNHAISLGIKSRSRIIMSPELREELEAWKFLDTWQGKMVWKQEKHLFIEIFSDSSTFKWGGVIQFESGRHEIYDFWSDDEQKMSIMVLEAKALLNVLRSVKDRIFGRRVDSGVDNLALLNGWKNEGTRSRELNKVLKDIFDFVLEHDIILNLVYVKSAENVADAPSRTLNKTDASLTRTVWDAVQKAFGGSKGHTVDLMSLDSNCMTDLQGNPLKHYSPFRTPGSAGINVFSQEITAVENCYVFPPFSLIAPVISFIEEGGLNCTIIVPACDITPVWQPNVADRIKDALLVGVKGQKGVLRYPSKKGLMPDKSGLPWNLWAVRFVRDVVNRFQTYGALRYLRGPGRGSRMHLLAVEDSMLRFLKKVPFFNCPMVSVVAIGGALVWQVEQALQGGLERVHPGLILVHAGVNNLSKNFLYRDEYHQLQAISHEIEFLVASLTKYEALFPESKIILSSVSTTRDGSINMKAGLINEQLKLYCKQRCWCFMDNSNIMESHLRDTVHFNSIGEERFSRTLRKCIEAVIAECNNIGMFCH